MARKQRIVIKVVTKDGSHELSIVEGREMANGKPAPGPSTKQLDIARQAIVDLCAAEDV